METTHIGKKELDNILGLSDKDCGKTRGTQLLLLVGEFLSMNVDHGLLVQENLSFTYKVPSFEL